MTEAARQALRRIDAVLADNSDSLKSSIANLNTFTGALARNSDRVDGILVGSRTHDRRHARQADARALRSHRAAHLSGHPTSRRRASSSFRSRPPCSPSIRRRIIVAPGAGESPPVDNAQWRDNIPKLLQAKLIESFENANYRRRRRTADGRAHRRLSAADRHSQFPDFAGDGRHRRRPISRRRRLMSNSRRKFSVKMERSSGRARSTPSCRNAKPTRPAPSRRSTKRSVRPLRTWCCGRGGDLTARFRVQRWLCQQSRMASTKPLPKNGFSTTTTPAAAARWRSLAARA